MKLSSDQKETIAGLKGKNITKLAKYYGVSRRTIQFIQYPERRDKMLAKRDWKKYYNKDNQNAAMRDLREYKRQLRKEGKI